MSALVAVLKNPRDPAPEETGLMLGPGVYVHTPILKRDQHGRVYSVSGSGVFGASYVDQHSKLGEAELDALLGSPAQVARTLRGSLGIFCYDPRDGVGVFVPDPLGSCPLHVYEDASRLVITSDLSVLKDYLRELGIRLKKSAVHVASMFVAGVGGLGTHPYADVRLADQLAYTRLGPGVMESHRYGLGSELEAMRSLSYADALEQTWSEIEANALAFHRADHTSRIAHLSGGFDSRLVFSFLSAAGIDSDYVYFCSGGTSSPDRQVFEKLARHFSLTSSKTNGISVKRYPGSFLEEVLGPLEFSHGLAVSGPTSDWLATDTGILAGGYGELLRAFYSGARADARLLDSREVVRLAWGQNVSSTSGNLLSRASLQRLGESGVGAVREAMSLGLDEDAQADYLYLHRARMFVGQMSYMHSRLVSRFDPLYSLSGTALALTSSAAVRQANVIGFDLMDRNVPGLKGLPFDSDRFSAAYMELRGRPAVTSWRTQSAPLVEVYPRRLPAASGPTNYTPRPSSADLEWAQRKRASLRQVIWAETVRRENLEIITQLGEDPGLRDAFEVDNLVKTLGRPFPNRVVLRSMTSLYGLLHWYVAD